MSQTRGSVPGGCPRRQDAPHPSSDGDSEDGEEDRVGPGMRCRRCGTAVCMCTEAEVDAGGPGE